MSPDLRITPGQWLAAGTAALALHAMLIVAIGGAIPRSGGSAGPPGTPEARLRLSLGRPSPPATVPPAASVRRPGPLPPAPTPRPAPMPVRDAPAGVAAAAAAAAFDPQADAQRDTQTAGDHQGRLAPAGVPGVAPDATGEDGSSIDGDAGADYFDALFDRVSAALDYPRRARLNKIEGTVVLSIRIDREGRIERAEVAESSGSPLLDRHAMRVARRAAPFGAVPDFFADTDLIFELPVEFALTH